MKRLLLIGLVTIWPLASCTHRSHPICLVAHSHFHWETTYWKNDLAPRPLFFHDPESIEEWTRAYHELKKWIHDRAPGAEILITRIDNPPQEWGWERVPIIWQESHVWIKRKPRYDRGSKHANSQGEARLLTSDA